MLVLLFIVYVKSPPSAGMAYIFFLSFSIILQGEHVLFGVVKWKLDARLRYLMYV